MTQASGSPVRRCRAATVPAAGSSTPRRPSAGFPGKFLDDSSRQLTRRTLARRMLSEPSIMREAGGFTLIELVVILVVLGILA
ncbi:MAG TPA: prepilin-type N-terminal cleavage/methylation domain-containing protein, partial [Steroidobacteraceae bacterium]|nr:prepilin-type N-terminal cleavage/methylation domain-containing protein [Steroidobacteraceae bacterium]